MVGARRMPHHDIAGRIHQGGNKDQQGPHIYGVKTRPQNNQSTAKTDGQGAGPMGVHFFAQKQDGEQSGKQRRGENQRLGIRYRNQGRPLEITDQENKTETAAKQVGLVVLRTENTPPGFEQEGKQQHQIDDDADEGDLKWVDMQRRLPNESGHQGKTERRPHQPEAAAEGRTHRRGPPYAGTGNFIP